MGKSRKFEISLEEYNIIERNKRSQELFDKNEALLQIAEVKLLDEYIHDLEKPKWRQIIYKDNVFKMYLKIDLSPNPSFISLI